MQPKDYAALRLRPHHGAMEGDLTLIHTGDFHGHLTPRPPGFTSNDRGAKDVLWAKAIRQRCSRRLVAEADFTAAIIECDWVMR